MFTPDFDPYFLSDAHSFWDGLAERHAVSKDDIRLRWPRPKNENSSSELTDSFQVGSVDLPLDATRSFLLLVDQLPRVLFPRSSCDSGRLCIGSRMSLDFFERFALDSSFGDGFGVV